VNHLGVSAVLIAITHYWRHLLCVFSYKNKHLGVKKSLGRDPTWHECTAMLANPVAREVTDGSAEHVRARGVLRLMAPLAIANFVLVLLCAIPEPRYALRNPSQIQQAGATYVEMHA